METVVSTKKSKKGNESRASHFLEFSATHGLYSPCNSLGQNTGVDGLSFSRGSKVRWYLTNVLISEGFLNNKQMEINEQK